MTIYLQVWVGDANLMQATSVTKRNRLAIGFLTALVSHELVSAEKALGARGWQKETSKPELTRAGVETWAKDIDGRSIVAYTMAINEMGQSKSAIETIAFLNRTQPFLNFLVGIAGSLRMKEIHREDVVIADGVYWSGQNKIEVGDPCDVYRTKNYQLRGYSPDLARRLARFSEFRHPKSSRDLDESSAKHVHVGKVFTWDYVINSEKITKDILKRFPESLCVEMEAGGFMAAIERSAQVNGKPSLGFVVRGISDYAEKKIDINNIRATASENAMHVAIDLAEWLLTVEQFEALKQEVGRRA